MKIIIQIETGNAALATHTGDTEINRILSNWLGDYENGKRPDHLVDINGNQVGTVKYTGKQ